MNLRALRRRITDLVSGAMASAHGLSVYTAATRLDLAPAVKAVREDMDRVLRELADLGGLS